MALVAQHASYMQCIVSKIKSFACYCDNSGPNVAASKHVVSVTRLSLSHSYRLSRFSTDPCQKISVGVTKFESRKAWGRRPVQLAVSTSGVRSATTSIKKERLGSCLVFPPSTGRKPHSIIKFLGGAFISAIPEVAYGLLIDLLAGEDFLVVAVPYNVTFDHEKAAKEVYEKFNTCLDMLYATGLPDADLLPSDVLGLPVYSVGHSNGALLQLLSGSYFSEMIPKANAVISYNNRPAAEAVPYFEQFGPLVTQITPVIEASPMYAMARTASGDALKTLFDTAASIIEEYDREAVISLTRFTEQLPLVMNQVYEGVSEFKPTPFENRNFVKNSYNVQQTLLVKFNFDSIDETDIIEEILRPRVNSMGGRLEKVILNGSHVTPCAQDIKWQVGDLYTPADALAQGLKSASLNDTRVLARTISDWFRGLVGK
ncbi:uncharacterized protein LOC116264297 [Nymphaea colorata]|nr:uncharacterized protein LOC116264297 [Nymphaea colorata]XP_031500295.1 uncharacterized protein LOC116264297 [Nymphaea colorata]XP_031500296.1 uncharacterized protein LOC116264297 [Nymphaea colorata]XP_049936531.1 uncharacterized protein LOC116264297 [Nymphaea colorata]